MAMSAGSMPGEKSLLSTPAHEQVSFSTTRQWTGGGDYAVIARTDGVIFGTDLVATPLAWVFEILASRLHRGG
jgi:hypothetical protein